MKTQSKHKRGKQLKVTKKGPPRARRLRRKRKRRFLLTPWPRERGEPPQVRGSGPPIHNVEVLDATDGGLCPRCNRQVSSVVIWEYWHRGTWRRTSRALCSKHARSLKSQLGRARAQRDGDEVIR